jgi:hypothetical protein
VEFGALGLTGFFRLRPQFPQEVVAARSSTAEERLSGVAVATFSEGQNLNFAIPASYLASLLKRVGEARTLSSAKEAQADTKPRALSGKTTGGVSGSDYVWGNGTSVSFTLLNQTGSSVKNIRFLVVFFKGDKKKGYSPIDYLQGETCKDVVILPNLPKRQNTFRQENGCYELFSNWETKNQTRRVEIRVLDFKLAD